MSTFSRLQSNDKIFVGAALLCLFLTTFPLAQGRVPIGDIIPRSVFLVLVAVLYSNLLFTIDGALLAMYFFYMIVCGAQSLSDHFLANVMEQLIPLVLAQYFLNRNNNTQAVFLGKIMALASICIMLNTIIVDYSSPNIVRTMVALGARGEITESLYYTRLGVCIYSFAMIAMCLAPVFLYLSKKHKHKLLLLLCFIVTCYFVYIAGITTCFLILFVMLVMYFVSATNKMRFSVAVLIPIAIFMYVFGLFIVEFLLPYFEGTNFYGHLGGLMEFYGKTTMVTETYDVGERADLYKDSFETFIHNPLFGNVAGKNGGHNFFLDHLAQMGLIGMTPFIIYMYRRFKFAYNVLSKEQRTVYLICIIGFLMLGFLKGMNGIDFWTYMFVYIPCILKCCEPKESYQ